MNCSPISLNDRLLRVCSVLIVAALNNENNFLPTSLIAIFESISFSYVEDMCAMEYDLEEDSTSKSKKEKSKSCPSLGKRS